MTDRWSPFLKILGPLIFVFCQGEEKSYKIYLFGCIMYPARLLPEKCYIMQICIRYIKMLVVVMGRGNKMLL